MLTRLGGQDAAVLISGPNSTAEELDMIRAELGLDQPLLTQFWIYISNAVQGDLGISWINNRPVLTDLLVRLPVTLELLFWGVGLGALIGIPVGLRAAQDHNKRFDQIVRFFSLLGFSIPTYFLGLVMILVFFLLPWMVTAGARQNFVDGVAATVGNLQLLDRRYYCSSLGRRSVGIFPTNSARHRDGNRGIGPYYQANSSDCDGRPRQRIRPDKRGRWSLPACNTKYRGA
jgi:hypothetical protein